MSPLQPRPTAVLIGAMSLLCRCRAFSSAKPMRPLFTSMVTAGEAMPSRRGGATAFAFSSARMTIRREIRNRRPADGTFVESMITRRGESSSDGITTLLAGRPGRRRRRTALGMVSDQPFQSPNVEEQEKRDFRSLGLQDDLVGAMDEFGFESPSRIQGQAIPEILKGGNVVVAAETGSGKTLAYLLPLVQQLKQAEAVAADRDGSVRRMQRPRALILVPTRELAIQVLEVCKRIARTCKFSSCGVMGGEDYTKQKKLLAGTVDLIVASPGRLLKHHEQGNFFMSQVTHVVIDEVDTMMTQGFRGDIEKLSAPILTQPTRRDRASFVFVTATFTKAVRRLLDEGKYPKVRVLETRSVHHSLPSMKHVMMDIKGRDKISALVDVTRQYRRSSKRTLIFCNTVKSCRAAEHALREMDLQSLSYHGEVPSHDRAANLERFKDGEVDILVCTDIAARGLDMPEVDHVVMFDFPLNPIDYLHRSGRTARMGASGRVTSLLAKRDLVLASAIERAVQAGMPLDELSSRRTDYAAGEKLGPLFGRQGRAKGRGNHHVLKSTINIRARGGAEKDGTPRGKPRKKLATAAEERSRRKLVVTGVSLRGGKGGPGRARKYN